MGKGKAAAQSLEAVHASVAAAECRELAAVHRLEEKACAHEGSSCGRESLLAEVFEGVVAAFEQLARERQAGAVASEPLGGL